MSGPAEVLVRARDGIFVADECELADRSLTAHGRWQHRCGPNNAETRWGREGTYTWPLQRVKEIRWLEGAR